MNKYCQCVKSLPAYACAYANAIHVQTYSLSHPFCRAIPTPNHWIFSCGLENYSNNDLITLRCSDRLHSRSYIGNLSYGTWNVHTKCTYFTQFEPCLNGIWKAYNLIADNRTDNRFASDSGLESLYTCILAEGGQGSGFVHSNDTNDRLNDGFHMQSQCMLANIPIYSNFTREYQPRNVNNVNNFDST